MNNAKPTVTPLPTENWLKRETQRVKLSAQQVLKKAKEQEKEKIASGNFESVIITPPVGKPYSVLRKKK